VLPVFFKIWHLHCAPAKRSQTILWNRGQLTDDVDLLEAVQLAVLHEMRTEQGVPALTESIRSVHVNGNKRGRTRAAASPAPAVLQLAS
jgi:hypothetical protein